MAQNTLKKVGTMISPEIHAKLKSLAAARGVKLQDAFAEAIARWMRSQGQDVGEIYPYPERHREWHDRLEAVLCSSERVGIEWNLTWATSHLEKQAAPPDQQRGRDPHLKRRVG